MRCKVAPSGILHRCKGLSNGKSAANSLRMAVTLTATYFPAAEQRVSPLIAHRPLKTETEVWLLLERECLKGHKFGPKVGLIMS